MAKHRTTRRVALGSGLATAFLMSGCTMDVADSGSTEGEVTGTEGEALNVTSTTIWTKLSIPVCWENPSAASSTRRGWVKDQMTNSWQKYSQVRFTGWGTCSSSSSGLRLQIVDDQNSSTGTLIGKDLNGVKNGIKLNLNMKAPQGYADCAAKASDEACVRSTSMHEFGHALGFEHEQMRTDNPDFDCFLLGGGLGDTYVGQYDESSIMRTCTVADSVSTKLSSTDKLGLQAFYGNPSPAGVKRDVYALDDETYIFFFGKNMTWFSVSENKSDSYFPGRISDAIVNWPTSSPWTSGVDAVVDYSSSKVYFFSGSQYARYDRAAGRIDSGYPKSLPGGWNNWPASWTSVDSAIRWTNDKVYLFRGSEYVRLTGTTVDSGYPRPISGNWDIHYTSGFDYGFVYPNGKAYFFKDSEYVRVGFDDGVESVDSGYPKQIVGRWPGVPF